MGSSHDRQKKPMMSPSVRSPAQKETRSKSDERLRPKPTVTGAQGGALNALGKTPQYSNAKEALLDNSKENRFAALDEHQIRGISRILARVAMEPEINEDDKRKVYDAAFEAIQLLLKQCQSQGMTDLAQIAYLLATTERESRFGVKDHSWAPGHNQMYEYSGLTGEAEREYFNEAYSNRAGLGNQGGNDGFDFRGRGYVQLTGRYLYDRLGDEIGIDNDLVNYPDNAAHPSIAAEIAVVGMNEGHFIPANGPISDYVNENMSDAQRLNGFREARNMVNPNERGAPRESIAQRAERFYTELKRII